MIESEADAPSTWRTRLPGLLASGLMLVATGLWTFWGFMEMYHEGWGQPGLYPLTYLTIAAVFTAFWLFAEALPRAGGWFIIVAGLLFTAWILSMQLGRGSPTLLGLLSWFPVTAMVVLVGGLFVAEGRRRLQIESQGRAPAASWVRRNLRFLIPPAVFLVIGLGCTAVNRHVFSREDDGDRGMRLISGDGVNLIWAPAGPGWAQSEAGSPRNPSWNQIALYGMEPVGFGEKPGHEDRDATPEEMERYGLFRYLAADGMTLESEPQDIWRMPTVDEIVRSLVRDGENAGCVYSWDRDRGRASCEIRPDKETPLWAPDHPFIYMWAASEHDSTRAHYVCYNGWVQRQPKSWGNPRHGHRFVRDPLPEEIDLGREVLSEFLEETPHLDFSDPVFAQILSRVTTEEMTLPQKLEALFYFTRDSIPFAAAGDQTASGALRKGRALCYTKAMVLVAFSRKLGVPARLASQQWTIDGNPGSSPVSHGIAKVFFGGRWTYLDTVSNRDAWSSWDEENADAFRAPVFSLDRDVLVGERWISGVTIEDCDTNDVPPAWLEDLAELEASEARRTGTSSPHPTAQ